VVNEQVFVDPCMYMVLASYPDFSNIWCSPLVTEAKDGWREDSTFKDIMMTSVTIITFQSSFTVILHFNNIHTMQLS